MASEPDLHDPGEFPDGARKRGGSMRSVEEALDAASELAETVERACRRVAFALGAHERASLEPPPWHPAGAQAELDLVRAARQATAARDDAGPGGDRPAG